MESVDRSGQRLRQLLIMGALVAALYVWAFGFKERAAHFDFMAERQAQKQQIQAQTTKTPDQSPKSVTPEQMPSGLYPAFLQAQQRPEHLDNYAIAATKRGLEAKKPANGFNSRFTGGGVEFDGWQMRLSGLGWSGQTPAPTKDTAPVVKDNRVEYHRMGGLTEWYLNGPLGLEQGFTLAQPLAAPPEDGWLSLELSLQGATATSTGQGDWLALNPASGPALRYGKLYAYDAGGATLPARLEVKPGGKGLRLLANVQGARFPVTVDPFVQQQMLTAADGAANDQFGISVALNSAGDTALIGAPYKTIGSNLSQGAAYVFSRSGSFWTQQQVLSDTVTGVSGEYFGISVALNSAGDTALIGAPYKMIGTNNYQGAAYIFSRSGSFWTQQQVLSDTTTGASGDGFSVSVALNSMGDTALIGAYSKQVGANAQQGVAYVFGQSGSVWTQQQVLSDTIGGGSRDWFGASVAFNSIGDIALVGAQSKMIGANTYQGVAYVFSQSGLVWTQQQILSDTITGAGGDYFGYSVVLNAAGDLALISAVHKNIGTNFGQGAAYVFSRNGSVWTQQQILSDTITGAGGNGFGSSVALNSAGDTALIGAYGKQIGANSSQGAVYAFNRTGTVWTQRQALSDTISGAASDYFGYSVALNSSGGTAIIGAYNKKIGANPTQGTAYIFQLLPASTINLTNAPTPSILGQSVTFTATVSPITATGTVTFIERATVLGTGTLSGGIATFSTTSLSAGSHVISATYGGDSNLAFSSSNPVTQVVNKAATILDLTSAPNPSTFGQSVTFTATVSPITATGTVTFTEGAAILGTGTLSSGVATFATAALPVGSHVISATYGGDSNYTGSASPTITQVVGCNPNDALVTNINDDGTGAACGSFSYALVHASPGVTITFALTQSNTITFSGSLTPTVPMSVTIDGGSGAGIVLDGNGMAGDGLRLTGGDTIINLTIKHFGGRELVTEGPGNRLSGVRLRQT